MPEIGKAGPGEEADIASSDDGHAHDDNTPLAATPRSIAVVAPVAASLFAASAPATLTALARQGESQRGFAIVVNANGRVCH